MTKFQYPWGNIMNKFNLTLSAACVALASISAVPAQAAINAPVPVENFINVDGLDWVWASPCSPDGCWAGSGIDMSYQSTQGWRIPTYAEFAARPEESEFGGKCGSAYFTEFSWCDAYNGQWDFGYGLGSTDTYSETWLVRGDLSGAVPEPASWAMMIGGLGLVGATMRRRATKVSFA
jgi:hypothetical protein